MLFITPNPDRPPDAGGAGNGPWGNCLRHPLPSKGIPPNVLILYALKCILRLDMNQHRSALLVNLSRNAHTVAASL